MTATRYKFTKATKAGSKARIALIGGPGSGKTWTALEIVKGLETPPGTRPGLIDTDRQSAKKYADVFDFQWIGMSTFDPTELTRAVIDAGQQGIDPLIVDTWSPFWEGQDGMLDQVNRASTSFEGWRQMRPVERQMFDALLAYQGHVVVTLRTKIKYVVETNDQGKAEPRRVGIQPIQRDGIEYEFDVVADLESAGAILRVSKTRCPELANAVFTRPTGEVGERVQSWLNRAAHGELLSPHTVRDWALADGRTFEELGERYRELEAVGQGDAVVYDVTGEKLISIAALLRERGHLLRREQERAAARAAREQRSAQAATG